MIVCNEVFVPPVRPRPRRYACTLLFAGWLTSTALVAAGSLTAAHDRPTRVVRRSLTLNAGAGVTVTPPAGQVFGRATLGAGPDVARLAFAPDACTVATVASGRATLTLEVHDGDLAFVYDVSIH